MLAESMTRKQLEEVPIREWSGETKCKSLIILPTARRHDSGYRIMHFIAVGSTGEPICQIAGGIDVAVLQQGLQGWMIDCLPKTGLLRLFKIDNDLIAGSALSSFCVSESPKKLRRVA